MKYPTKAQLAVALDHAAELHHSYEQAFLKGNRDTQWAGFYAAYIIGRHGDFLKAEALAGQLEKVPVSENWTSDAAEALCEMPGGASRDGSEKKPPKIVYVCPHCFSASEKPGICEVCGEQKYEFRPGDLDDPCRCPVINEQGEVVTHAPLWWLRSVAPELAERMEKDKNNYWSKKCRRKN